MTGCLEGEQVFVFNLSKLSCREFKPFVPTLLALNSTFSLSTERWAHSWQKLDKRAAGETLSNSWSRLLEWVAAKILPPSCFFSTTDPRDFTPFNSGTIALVVPCFTMAEVCNTQREPAPPDMASISSRASCEVKSGRAEDAVDEHLCLYAFLSLCISPLPPFADFWRLADILLCFHNKSQFAWSGE